MIALSQRDKVRECGIELKAWSKTSLMPNRIGTVRRGRAKSSTLGWRYSRWGNRVMLDFARNASDVFEAFVDYSETREAPWDSRISPRQTFPTSAFPIFRINSCVMPRFYPLVPLGFIFIQALVSLSVLLICFFHFHFRALSRNLTVLLWYFDPNAGRATRFDTFFFLEREIAIC